MLWHQQVDILNPVEEIEGRETKRNEQKARSDDNKSIGDNLHNSRAIFKQPLCPSSVQRFKR
jgi:hypothetical protein